MGGDGERNVQVKNQTPFPDNRRGVFCFSGKGANARKAATRSTLERPRVVLCRLYNTEEVKMTITDRILKYKWFYDIRLCGH